MNPERPHGHFSLFLDVDGTLIDIAAHPDSVFVPRSLVRDLRLIEIGLGGALALISGRTISNLDALFKPLRLRAGGVHGAEFRFDPAQGSVVAVSVPLPMDAWIDLLRLVDAFPGTMAENKAFSFAVHYRAVPESRPLLQSALEAFVAAHADLQLRIMPGHFVFELKRSDFNKGVAIKRFLGLDEFLGRRPIFIGDDVTDWPGFETAVAHDGLAYSVGSSAPGVTGMFANPAAVRNWLRQITLLETVTV